MSLRKIIINTTAISSVNVLRMLAQFFAVPILSRLLSPADYGLVGMAMPFVLFAMMIADAGVGMSLVRTSDEQREEWSTCFWLSVIIGVAAAIIITASAPLTALAFGEPRLIPIVMTLSLVVLAQAIVSIPGASLQQNHQFKLIATIEITAVVVGIGVAVWIALHGGGAWALVGQQLAFFAIRLVGTVYFSSFRPALVFDLACVKEHLVFGRNVLSVNIIGFFTRSIDNLFIGKGQGTAAVGIYSMAFQFARLPIMVVTGPLQYVLYAQLAQMKDNTQGIRRAFLILTRILAIFIFPAMGIVAVAHQPVFKLLLSEKWAAAGTLFMIVAPAMAVQAITGLTGTVMMVKSRTDIQLKTTLEFGLFWILALIISVWFGLNWVGIAYDVVVLLYTPRLMYWVLPLVECTFKAYAQSYFVPLMLTGMCILGYLILAPLFPGYWTQLSIAALLLILTIGIGALLQRRAIMEEILLWRASDLGTANLQ